MKKFFRAFALLLVIGVISTPVSAFAATIDHVEEYEGFKRIYYSPNDLLIINSGSTAPLKNTTNGGNWFFQPGRNAQVLFELIMPADFNIILYKSGHGGGEVVTYPVYNSASSGAAFEVFIEEPGDYVIILQPLNGTTVIVDNFYVWY